MTRDELRRLNEADSLIRDIAADLGLELLPQEFDVVPDHKMLEIMAYRLPVPSTGAGRGPARGGTP